MSRALTRLAAIPVVAISFSFPWQCSLLSQQPPAPDRIDAGVPPYEPKTRERPVKRETLSRAVEPDPKPQRPVNLSDEVVVHTLDLGRPSFLRCFRKASDADPSVRSFKVTVHVDVGPTGTVTAATTDAEDPALAACLIRVSRGLPFPAPKQPAVADFPLFFRPDQ
jgi:hypothetical protein